ncbi:4-hydroxy-tetrahydrodipicolinate synthase [Pandoraea faecigallinarum]|uniref:4-hydroxy-tetrahydrodipicolinate synthase n=1 Tax=Pandoraea faecigallinarum TaxID=656179 RepID=A0A0H3WUM0_9BURK|nr:4-hydroxy-tetrahydrodipicolinate synthase [Pandoraea faecigallinarum]AKM31437.1 4-hydroxy-tetrahydrodipicolinate synthase [Pandoraea faecigallinarum]
MNTAIFEGVWVPLVTPMTGANGAEIDRNAFARLVDYYLAAGVNGLVVAGTTGEGTLLSDDERRWLAEVACHLARGHAPVLAGVGASDTANAARQIRALDDLPLAGYLVPPPYYLRPSQEGILWHYRSLAAGTRRPLVLYNVPLRTGVTLGVETIRELASHESFAAIKECDAHPLTRLPSQVTIRVLCGDDMQILPALRAGAAGCISAAAHVRPDLYLKLIRYVREGDMDHASTLFNGMKPLIRRLFSEPNPVAIKAALASLGLCTPTVRRPLMPCSTALHKDIDAQLEVTMAF